MTCMTLEKALTEPNSLSTAEMSGENPLCNLMENQVIAPKPKIKNNNKYRLNPNFGYDKMEHSEIR